MVFPSEIRQRHDIFFLKVVEFDTPFNLIQKPDGVFRSMCLKSGMFGKLEATARSKAESDTFSNTANAFTV
jgi:hypothetical protein